MRNHIKKVYELVFEGVYALFYALVDLLPTFKLYQPLYGSEDTEASVRGCEDRWKAMETHLNGKGSVLDIGCNIGYFSFKAAEKGHLAFGIEADPIYLSTCNAVKTNKNVENAFFVKGMVTPDFIKSMPSYDVVINLSVFHHWVKAYGADTAQEMMRGLAAHCNAMVFETGQSNETGTKWAKKLDFMGKDPKKWTKAFLKEIGFKTVKVIGDFDSGLTDVQRQLYWAEK